MRKIIACPDVHHPYADRSAWSAFLRFVRQIQPDDLVIMGDFADCYTISVHDKDPQRCRMLASELDASRTELVKLRRAAAGARMWYLEGNHEERLVRYVMRRAPELHGMVSIPGYLGLSELGVRWVPYRQLLHIGNIALVHDQGYSGGNAGAQTLSALGENVVVAHNHRLGVTYTNTLANDPKVSLNVGWLGLLEEAKYAPAAQRRHWMHGCGLIEQSGGFSTCHAVPIYNGKAR